MRVETMLIPMIRAILNRPKLADKLFQFDKWGNEFGDDRYEYPYPIYDRMRVDGAITYRRMYRQWIVTGHEELKEVLSSSHMIITPQRETMLATRPYTKLGPEARSFVNHLLLLVDPPDHTRLRRLVLRAFSPRQISRIEAAVGRLAESLVADMLATSGPDRKPVDVFGSFTAPLPINVICELLGLPEDRWDWAAKVSDQISLIGNIFSGFDPVLCSEAIADMRSYFLELAAERRAEPRDDLITELAAVEEGGDRLNDDELVAMAGALMFAGHETTSGLLGNSIIALGNHPDQRELIRNKPELWDNAVEELLRWDSPAQAVPRTAGADLEMDGQLIKKGANIIVLFGAANRDPNFYDDPNVLRLDRKDPQPVSFGHGTHHCLGHALARMETKVAMRAFVEAFGNYTVDMDKVEWKRSIVTRGPIRLPVRPGADAVLVRPSSSADRI